MVDMLDVVIVIYNYAVVVSSAYVMQASGAENRFSIFLIGGVLALFWTAYFKWDMVSRIVNQATDDGDAIPEEDAE